MCHNSSFDAEDCVLEPTHQKTSPHFSIIFGGCQSDSQPSSSCSSAIPEGQNLDLLRQTLQWLATMKQATGNYPVVYLDFKRWWIFDPPKKHGLMAVRCCNRFLFPSWYREVAILSLVSWCKCLRMSFLVVMSQNLEERKRHHHVSALPMAFSCIHEISWFLILQEFAANKSIISWVRTVLNLLSIV